MKIKSIKVIDSTDPVYDIEIASSDHTFLIGSTCVHNCRLKSNIEDPGFLQAFQVQPLK